MNKHAFLILAHDHPDYLDFNISRLGAGCSDRTNIYIHINSKYIDSFQDVINKYRKCTNVKFYSQIKLNWGGYQIIEVQHILLRQALANDENFYFHLLSNADFLCRPLDELIDFFDDPQHQGKEYIECAPIREVWSLDRIKIRFYCWNIHDFIDTRRWHLGLVNRYCCKLQWMLHIRRKEFPFGQVYAGSTWWTLSRAGAECLLKVFDNKKISRRFHFIYAPDEIFTSTIIGNSGLLVVNEFCLRNRDASNAGIPSFRYIPWWKKGDWFKGIHPLTLDESDYALIKKSGAFFCRKISMEHSKTLLKRLLADENSSILLSE